MGIMGSVLGLIRLMVIRKLVIILSLLFLIGCDDSFSQDPSEVKAASDSNISWVEAPVSMKRCNDDSDCVLVDKDCHMCCETDVVNKAFIEKFKKYKEQICTTADIGFFCDCVNMVSGAICNKEGICQLVMKTF